MAHYRSDEGFRLSFNNRLKHQDQAMSSYVTFIWISLVLTFDIVVYKGRALCEMSAFLTTLNFTSNYWQRIERVNSLAVTIEFLYMFTIANTLELLIGSTFHPLDCIPCSFVTRTCECL